MMEAMASSGVGERLRLADAFAGYEEMRERRGLWLRPLGWVVIVIVAVSSIVGEPPPGIRGVGLAVSLALTVYVLALATASLPWCATRSAIFQAVTVVLIGASGVALAALQPHGLVELAASVAVWLSIVRLPMALAAPIAAGTTAALAVAVTLTQHPEPQLIAASILLCVLLAMTAFFMRSAIQLQRRSELLVAELQTAHEAEAEAIATLERGRIAGELHDVLAHALAGLSIQLEGARKLAEREDASPRLREVIARSGELTKEGLVDARKAVTALRGAWPPELDQVPALVNRCRRDLNINVAFAVEGAPRELPSDASLALYRGVEEALTNVARYAPRSVSTVTLTYLPGLTRLCIDDARVNSSDLHEGWQEDPGQPRSVGEGHGLAIMRERVARASGGMHAGPTANGWRVELEIPA
jgi:signal transduction histidine kinase